MSRPSEDEVRKQARVAAMRANAADNAPLTRAEACAVMDAIQSEDCGPDCDCH